MPDESDQCPDVVKGSVNAAASASQANGHKVVSLDVGVRTTFVLGVALVMVGGTVWFVYFGWTAVGDVDMPAAGYGALLLGVVVTLLIGCGLMALIFYSHGRGYDLTVERKTSDQE